MKIFLHSFSRPRILVFLVILILLGTAVLLFYPAMAETKNLTPEEILSDKIIAIDPGHGGIDPGAVGVTGVLEKDINLSLSLYLRDYLEKAGAEVILTREKDYALSPVKKEDLDARAKIAAKAEADIFISMQCNAIPDQSCHGAQVFFYPESSRGEALAKAIQAEIWEAVSDDSHREAQRISAPYILKAVSVPAVIVEAGFLSNPQEEALLQDSAYQKKIAAAVYHGIIQYYRDSPVFSLFN